MKWHALDGADWAKAIGIGLAVSILTAAFMVATFKAGVSPLPKSLGLAFAETVLRRPLPLPVGLLFHTLWTTAFCVAFVGFSRDALTFMRALGLGVALWLLVLVVVRPRRRPEANRRRRHPASAVRRVAVGWVPSGIRPPRAGLFVAWACYHRRHARTCCGHPRLSFQRQARRGWPGQARP
jgi:hypothetical protein